MRLHEYRHHFPKGFIMTSVHSLPIVIIGAGPVGLAAAAHLVSRGLPYLVLEATDSVASCFRSTSHVRLFSPWKMNVDRAAAHLLEPLGWQSPDADAMPTAGEMRTRYLEPLAKALAPNVRFNTRVQNIGRRGYDKVKTVGRQDAPFVVRVRVAEGEQDIEARAVIDASGTWGTLNRMGANGLPARGEVQLGARIRYGIPDVLGAERERYAGKHVLVVGSGHSAAASLIALAELAEHDQRMRIDWAIRGDNLDRIFGGGAKDGLPERGSLGLRLRRLVEGGSLRLHRNFLIDEVVDVNDKLQVSGIGKDGVRYGIPELDEVVVATGARPDLSLARELRLALDSWLESTPDLAPLIDPNLHSCGSVPPHGHRELRHPEVGYYAIGAKSYGRAPNFLLATGYEQARSVVAALAGDMAAADDVQLVLPETGVCVTDFGGKSGGGGCCGAPRKTQVAVTSKVGEPQTGCCPAPSELGVSPSCCA